MNSENLAKGLSTEASEIYAMFKPGTWYYTIPENAAMIELLDAGLVQKEPTEIGPRGCRWRRI